MAKKKKKWILAGKILLWIVIFFFVVIPSLLFFAIQIPAIQRQIIPVIEKSASDFLGTKVTIGSLGYRFLLSLQLNDITIEDLQQQKLLTVKHCLVDIDKLDIFLRMLTVKEIALAQPEILLYRYQQQDSVHNNFDFLITLFQQPADTVTSVEQNGFSIKLHNFSINDLSARWIDSVKHQDILMEGINIDLRKIAMQRNDALSFTVKNFSCKDILGLSIQRFSCRAFIHADSINISRGEIEDRFSMLSMNVIAHKKHSRDKENTTLNDWNVVLELPQSNYFDSRSLQFVMPDIPHIIVNSLSGEIRKNQNDIIVSSPLTFSILNSIKGSISGKVSNILDIKNMAAHLMIDQMEGKGEDFNHLLDSLRPSIAIPPQISLLPEFTWVFQGDYQFQFNNGKLVHCSASNHLSHSTDRYFSLSLMAKSDALYQERLHTKAECILHNLPFSSVITQLPLDIADAKITTTGYIHTTNYKESQLSMTGIFDNLMIGNDRYQGVDVLCQLQNQQIDVSVESLDKRLKAKLTGYYHLLTERIQYSLNLQHVDLSALLHTDSLHHLSCRSYGNFTVNTLDTINGAFYFTDIVYNNKEIDSLQCILKSGKNISGIYLNSKSISAEISGKKHISQVIPTLQYVAKRYLSYTTENQDTHNIPADSSNYYRFRLTLHSNKWLQSLIPSFQIDGETVITGYLNTPESPLKCNINIPSFTYNNYLFSKTTLEAMLVDSLLQMTVHNEKIVNNDKELMQNIDIKGTFRAGRLQSHIVFQEPNSDKQSVLSFRAFLPHSRYNLTSKYIIETDASDIYLSRKNFKIHRSQIAFDSTELSIDNFAITSQNFKLSGNGKYSKKETDTLTFTFQNFDLALLNNPSNNIQLNGIVNGGMSISHITQDYNNITGQINCQQFQMNDYKVGDIVFTSAYLPQSNSISLSTQITRNDSVQANIEGTITSDFKSIDAQAQFNSFDLGVLNPILKDVLYITGFATGNVLITGKPSLPSMNGIVVPSFASIKVEATQCTYFIHEKEVKVVNSDILFDNFFAHDVKGNNFGANTRLYDLFGGVGVRVDVSTQNIEVFKVNEVQNPNFYGSAFGTGSVNVESFHNKTTVNVNARTEKGTHLIIPVVTSIDALSSNNSNIAFVTHADSIKNNPQKKVKDPSDVQLNLNVDVTPEASVELLLNPLTQENIQGYGEGKLTVDYNGLRNNALRIFGEYKLLKGDYMFSYYKLVNKKFALNSGSKVIFNGNLEDTRLDLVASYKARASLSELVGDTTSMLRRSTPIECNISISGNVYQPTLQVNITAPNADLDIQNKMRAALYDKDVVMMQFVSLLLTNRFIANSELSGTLSGSGSGSNMAALFTGELIASQVNSVLSQILPLSLDLKLSPSSDGAKTDVGVSVSSELNDWLMLNGSIEYLQKSSIRNETVQGDLSLEAKLDKEGNLRVKAFTQANDNQSLYEYDSQGLNNRHGIGIFYQKEFNSLKELFERKKKEMMKK